MCVFQVLYSWASVPSISKYASKSGFISCSSLYASDICCFVDCLSAIVAKAALSSVDTVSLLALINGSMIEEIDFTSKSCSCKNLEFLCIGLEALAKVNPGAISNADLLSITCPIVSAMFKYSCSITSPLTYPSASITSKPYPLKRFGI